MPTCYLAFMKHILSFFHLTSAFTQTIANCASNTNQKMNLLKDEFIIN